MKVLIINAGSSSLKYQLLETEGGIVLAKGNCERIGLQASLIQHTGSGEKISINYDMPNHKVAITKVLSVLTDKETGVISSMAEIEAVGHRVVHGGEAFAESVLIDDNVLEAIRDCFVLAPLHNPANLTGILACSEAMPEVPQVAVFDTAFHQTMPGEAFMYALPYHVYKNHKVRRYGFHGTSHCYVAQRAAAMLGRPIETLRLVTCHLGNGSSVAAVKFGKSIDTSMGMTPLAGICMGTRCGDIDPAIVPYLMEKEKLDINGIANLLNKHSGVAGISGVSSDFRDLTSAAIDGNERAQLALDMFSYECKKLIGSYAAAMGGLDAVVYTAGVGENTPYIREKSVEGLEFMGLSIDVAKNNDNSLRGQEVDMSTPDAKTRILVIPTNEELAIALETRRVVDPAKYA